jgi:acyl carrier protein
VTTTERVCDVVSSILRVPAESLDDRSSPDTLSSWDSLRHLQVVLALEEAFGVQFTVEEIEAMHSVGVITAIVESRMAETR